ncbi:MAG: hypothetical protein ACLTZY_03000 [Alistipes indistinctus]
MQYEKMMAARMPAAPAKARLLPSLAQAASKDAIDALLASRRPRRPPSQPC